MAFDIEKILNNPLLKRYHGGGETPVYFDLGKNQEVPTNDNDVKDYLQEKWADFNRKHGEIVKFVYRPNMPRIFPSGDAFDTNCFNTWAQVHDTFECTEIPQEIQMFMEHLFPEERAREYVYDWMANALQGRNFTYLTLVSAQGTGKGVFSYVMRELVGVANFAEVTSDTVKGRFNGELDKKHIVFLDELNVSMRDKDSVNRLKSLANPTISVEKKGQQRKTVENAASYMIATNQIKGIPVEDGDRRFSIVDMTDIKSRLVPEVQSLIVTGRLLCKDVIQPFFNYLIQRNINKAAMLVPYTGERSKDVVQSLLPDWIAVIEEEFYGKTEVSLLQVQVALEEAGIKPPGRRVLARAFKMIERRGADGRFFFDITERLRDW